MKPLEIASNAPLEIKVPQPFPVKVVCYWWPKANKTPGTCQSGVGAEN